MSTALEPADIEAATAVLRSGMLRAAGRCEELETRLGTMTGARHMMTCANGTCALQLAYEPLLSPGDEVLVPAWSYIATVSMVVARGCVPVFVDARPDTLQIDPADAARKITPRTRGIAATHLYGTPVDIDAVESLARSAGLKVVYDAAQAHLATYKGVGLGAFGDAVTYSFYATKNLGTGEGGAISCNQETLARAIRLLRSHGETDKYLHESVGYNYRMNDITGAIGCSKLDRLSEQTRRRQHNADRYAGMLASINERVFGSAGTGLTPAAITPGATSAYHLYTVLLDPAVVRCSRDEFCKALGAEGVPTAVHYPRALPRQPALSRWNREDCPVADSLSARVLCLPMHHALTDSHFALMAEAIEKVARAMRE
ncbi:MAG: DegT/DnrJ/EryC1/StrS family aminotransferase [Phycisphaeraceae bacterium]|nr:DegT/DnrJ/EryC1/StrS family aminotransferase [Phycisphaeraceae bacterium]HRJ49665.1 DegT/DnrJ/EryC1/StrS family aminotransferase [Phycisphaerales bacterium]